MSSDPPRLTSERGAKDIAGLDLRLFASFLGCFFLRHSTKRNSVKCADSLTRDEVVWGV